MISNSVWKKIKKIQSISWNPKHIAYDVLTTFSGRFPFFQKIINRIGESGENVQLNKSKFDLVDIKKLLVEDFYSSEGEEKCRALLEKYGVCLLPNFVSHETAITAGQEIRELLAQENFINQNGFVQAPRSDVDFEDTTDYQWQANLAKYKNYQQIVETAKPVLNIRSQVPGEPDSGMVDVFYIEKLAKKRNLLSLLACLDAAKEEKMNRFLSKLSGYGVRQSNLYYNAGVVSTRGPHIDNNSEQYKIFIYLTDVLEQENGPYCFVPGSHKKRAWMSKERVISSAKGYPSTEVSSFPREQATKMLGAAGTAIISCQSGIHFGCQQSEDGRRIVLVGNYN